MNKNKTRIKINFKRFTAFVSSLILSIVLLTISIDIIRFPECYFSVWRYQLQKDIEDGNAEAINYYNNVYVSNGHLLYGNNFINE